MPVTTSAIAASDITATKTDTILNDSLGDGKAQAGDTIKYNITITNNSATDSALNVTLSDTIDANTTLVSNSINAQPQARDDAYTTVGNTLLKVGVAAGPDPEVVVAGNVYSNDANATGTSSYVSNTQPANGTVTFNADGTFTYLPNANFRGPTDTFTYTVRSDADNTLTDTATVTINITGMVWYVNNAAAAGDGRSSSPFNAITATNINGAGGAGDQDVAGDYIYLFEGNAAYTTGLVLENNQLLYGSGVALVVPINATPTTLRAAGTRPTLSNGAGNALTLANNVTAQGLNLTAAANAAVFGSGISGTNNISDANVTTTGSGTGVSLTNQAGTFNYSGGGGSSISGNSTGTAVLISGGNGNIAFSNVPVSQNNGRAVDIQTRTGGTVSFESGSTVTQTAGSTDAVVLRNNTGGSVINFLNNVNLTTNAGRGLYTDNSTGNFTLNMNAAGNNINATGGAAIDVEDIAADLDFVNLTSTNSVAVGIRIVNLSNTPAGRSVTVTGTTTVTNSVATGVSVHSNAAAVTFATLNSAPATGQIALLVDSNSGTTTATSGTVTATDAIAISVLNSPLNMTLTSVSANNTGDSDPGVSLNGLTGTLVMQGGSLTGGNAQAFFANAQNGSITYNGTISQANAFRLIEVTNKTGGTVNFGGALTATGANSTGVRLNANGNTTFNFTGGMNLSTGTNDAFAATGGGTVNITQNNGAIVNTLTTTTGTALNVTSTFIGASGLTFRSINSNGVGGTKNGIILNTTGTTAGTHGGLTITGNGGTCGAVAATCTGGQIANKTGGADASATEGTGIYLKDTRDVNLTNVFLNDFANYAIYGNNVTNFTFTTSRVSGSNGTSSNPINEGCIRFDGLLGNALITGSNIGNTNTSGGATNALHVNNASGTLTLLDIQGSTIFNQNTSATPANSGQDAIFFGSPSGATGTMNLRLNNSSLTHARQFLLQVNIQGSTTSNLEITNNTLHNVISGVVNAGGGNNITGGGTNVYVKYLISGNSFRHPSGASNAGRSMTIGHASGNATFDGKFLNNTIGQTGVPFSGAGNAADGLGIFASGNNGTNGTSKALIQGNTIQRYGEVGILVNARQGSSTLDVTILGNIIREPGAAAQGAFASIWVNSGALPPDTNIVNVVIGSATVAANKNTLTNSDPNNATDVFLDKNTCGGCASQLRLYQNGSDAAGATIEDKVRDVLVDDNIGPLDLLAGFTNASAITLVPAGLPAQPTAVQMRPIDIKPIEGGASDNAAAAAATTTNRAVPVESSLTNPNAPVFIGAPRVAAQPIATGEAQAQATAQRGQATDKETSKSAAANGGNNVQPLQAAFPVNIAELKPGESVTITFQVTVNSNIANNVTSVSNQGQITGNFSGTVLTDDPTVAGTNNPTVTDILPRPTYTINDAKVPEPSAGSVNMPFTVTLSHAYGSDVSVNFSTADGTATAASGDYTSTSGTLTFAAGQLVQTISVPVLANGDSSDETFTVTLSNPVNSVLGAVTTATGTITEANPPGRVLISELRTSGPGGAGDDFIELYNNQDVSQDISGWAIVKSGASCGATPVIVAVIPAATTIPARGHYLVVGPQYSLAATFPGNATVAAVSDIESDRNIGLFNTSNLLNLSTTTREDAVGFDVNAGGSNNCDLLREGATLLSAGGSASQHSFARNLITGLPRETNDNTADFLLVSTTPAVAVGNNLTPALGAPGPENLAAPVQRNGQIKPSLVDGTVAATAPPNRVRSGIVEPGVPNAFGTLSIQRKFTNTLAVPVTRLRFRIVDLTTINNRPAGSADLRVLSSTGVVRNSAGTVVRTVNGLTLEAPPQPNGGGLNSALTVVLPGGMLAPGNSIEVQFLLGVQEQGAFSFFVNVEALPGPTGSPAQLPGANMKNGLTQKQQSVAEPAAEQKQPEQQ